MQEWITHTDSKTGAVTALVKPTPSGKGKVTKTEPAADPEAVALAAQHQLDPTKLKGTGEGGRITMSDVQAAVEPQG